MHWLLVVAPRAESFWIVGQRGQSCAEACADGHEGRTGTCGPDNELAMASAGTAELFGARLSKALNTGTELEGFKVGECQEFINDPLAFGESAPLMPCLLLQLWGLQL